MQGGPVGLPYNALAPWPLGWRSDKQESGCVSVWTRDYPRLSGTNILSGWLRSCPPYFASSLTCLLNIDSPFPSTLWQIRWNFHAKGHITSYAYWFLNHQSPPCWIYFQLKRSHEITFQTINAFPSGAPKTTIIPLLVSPNCSKMTRNSPHDPNPTMRESKQIQNVQICILQVITVKSSIARRQRDWIE